MSSSQFFNRFHGILVVIVIALSVGINSYAQKVDIFGNAYSDLPELPMEYQLLLGNKPLVKDVFDVYISNNSSSEKVVFISRDSLSDKMRRSTFVLHAYPVKDNLLDEKGEPIKWFNHDFKANVKSYAFNGSIYYVDYKDLPLWKYKRIEVGQWNYNRDKTRSWKSVLHLESRGASIWYFIHKFGGLCACYYCS